LQTSFAAKTGTFATTNYLIGASDKVKEGAFEWCFSDLPANVSPLFKWKKEKPGKLDDVEDCVHMTVNKGTFPKNMVLNDLSCDKTKMKYL